MAKLRATLKRVVEGGDPRFSRPFDWTIISLIMLSVIAFSLDTLPGLSPIWKQSLRLAEIVLQILFILEYLLRLYVANRARDYAFSFFGIIDLLAVLPFCLGLQLDLRSLRSVRILHLLRLFKLARYSKAMRRLVRALRLVKHDAILFFFTAGILLFIAASGIHYFENPVQPDKFASVFHSLWWAMCTLTTVGYGDVYPITFGGRMFTFFILMIGLGVVSVPAGLFASALTRASHGEDSGHPET